MAVLQGNESRERLLHAEDSRRENIVRLGLSELITVTAGPVYFQFFTIKNSYRDYNSAPVHFCVSLTQYLIGFHWHVGE